MAGVQRCLALSKSRDLIKLEAMLHKELDEILAQEELLWYQKSRVTWLRDGDRNILYFHLSTIARHWRNKISAIKESSSGIWLHENEEIKNHFVNYFNTLFINDGSVEHVDLPVDIFPEFTNADWLHLSQPYTKCEIEVVVKIWGLRRHLDRTDSKPFSFKNTRIW